MSKRMDALWRVVAFVWSFAAAFVAGIVGVVAVVWGVVDIVWQFIVGSDGLSASSRPAMLVKAVLRWPIDLQIYFATGTGEMQWLPDL